MRGLVTGGQRKTMQPTAARLGEIELFNLKAVPVTQYRYHGNTIPSPWDLNHA